MKSTDDVAAFLGIRRFARYSALLTARYGFATDVGLIGLIEASLDVADAN
jgi:hypothetical protein